MNYTPEGLGWVVRELRKARTPQLTQEELGTRAGYNTGAGVAVSRIEKGRSEPSPERLAGLAEALDLTPDRLIMLAAQQTEVLRAAGGTAKRSEESVNDRWTRVQGTVGARAKLLEQSANDFNSAHDRARDDFLLPFVRTADCISGAPTPPREDLDDTVPDEDASAEAAAQFRLEFVRYGVAQALSGAATGAAVGGAAGTAAAYASFTAAVKWGTASTGVAISGLHGVAASNAALARLGGGTLAAGGAGVAGGRALLGGLVAGPLILLAVGGAVLATRRNRQQQQQLKAELDEAEAQLDAQARGVQAFVDLVERATQTLDYIAVHGAHAHNRWSQRLGDATKWEDLSMTQQQQYDDFVQLCAAQLAVATFGPQQLLGVSGDDLDNEIDLMEQILEKSDDLVRSRV